MEIEAIVINGKTYEVCVAPCNCNNPCDECSLKKECDNDTEISDMCLFLLGENKFFL